MERVRLRLAAKAACEPSTETAEERLQRFRRADLSQGLMEKTYPRSFNHLGLVYQNMIQVCVNSAVLFHRVSLLLMLFAHSKAVFLVLEGDGYGQG